MKPIQIYRPPARTVVTETRQFLVDNTGRKGINAFSVATKVTEATLDQKDITIGPDNPYTIKDVHNILSIQCPHPIQIEMVAFGTLPEPEIRSEQMFHDATIEIGVANASRFVTCKVTDPDIFTPAPITISVQNMRTGETEEVTLQRIEQGVYESFLQTQNNDAQGTDFDGMMFCRKDDILRFTYEEPYDATGKSRVITKDQVVTLDFEPTTIEVPTTVVFGGRLNFRVRNPQEQYATITNVRSGSTLQVLHSAFVPIELTFDDGPDALAVNDNDVIQIVTKGKDIHGQLQNIVAEVVVRPADPAVIEAPTQVDITKPFSVLITDNSAGNSKSVVFRNQLTGAVFTYPLDQIGFNYSGKYGITFPTFHHIGLPGEPVAIEYTVGVTTVSKTLELIKPAMAECPAPAAQDPDVGVESAPVKMTVNGQFFLNGSFAGTIKLSADMVVRCTLIKA
jgi:hypothetical protein